MKCITSWERCKQRLATSPTLQLHQSRCEGRRPCRPPLLTSYPPSILKIDDPPWLIFYHPRPCRIIPTTTSLPTSDKCATLQHTLIHTVPQLCSKTGGLQQPIALLRRSPKQLTAIRLFREAVSLSTFSSAKTVSYYKAYPPTRFATNYTFADSAPMNTASPHYSLIITYSGPANTFLAYTGPSPIEIVTDAAALIFMAMRLV